jgi:hypothetical protein
MDVIDLQRWIGAGADLENHMGVEMLSQPVEQRNRALPAREFQHGMVANAGGGAAAGSQGRSHQGLHMAGGGVTWLYLRHKCRFGRLIAKHVEQLLVALVERGWF